MQLYAVLIDGFEQQPPEIESLLNLVQAEFGSRGVSLEIIHLRDLHIAYCQGCFKCWIKTPGMCIIADDAREVARKMVHADIVAYLTPILFGGPSHLLKKMLDRSISLVHPYFENVHGEYHHKKRYDKEFRIFVIGVLPQQNDSYAELFRSLITRNALNLRTDAYGTVVIDHTHSTDDTRAAIATTLSSIMGVVS